MFWLPCWFHQMKEMRGERKESKSKESVFFFLPCSSYSSILPDETWCFCTLKYTSNSGYKRAALLWRNFPMLQSLHNKSSSQQLGSHVFEEKANDTFVWPQRYNIKKKLQSFGISTFKAFDQVTQLIVYFHPCDEVTIFIPQTKETLNFLCTQNLLLKAQKWQLWHQGKINN